MDFYKYHALGNDYIVIDPAHFDIPMSRKNIRLICDRHYGVGSDGILSGPFFKGREISLCIYNPDGSEAEKSGNGIRIFSRYLLEAQYVSDDIFSLRTKGGKVKIIPHNWSGTPLRQIVECDKLGRLTLDNGRVVWPYRKHYEVS